MLSKPLILPRWLPLLAVLVLGGCAHSPGFYTGDSLKADAKNPDAVPPGALHSITPELLSQQRASRKDEIPAQVKQLFGTAKPYTIGSGDILNIVVWDHPQLSIAPAGAVATVGSDAAATASLVGNGYNVNPDGRIQFPYVGPIKLAGLTEYQARDLLTQQLTKIIKEVKF